MLNPRHFVFLAIAGISYSAPGEDPAPDGRVGAAPSEITDKGALESSCTDDSQCQAGHRCTSTGICACAPGHMACGRRCYDLSTDPHHCGSCDTACAPGEACVGGACDGPASVTPVTGPQPYSPTVGAPYEIDGASAATNCVQVNEGYPEQPLNYGTASLFIPYQSRSAISPSFVDTPYNWGSDTSSPASWPGPAQWIPYSGAIGQVHSDNWATTSGYTGLEYVSTIFTGPSGGCIGIAATSASNLANNPPSSPNWTFPLTCATSSYSHIPDGPSLHYDQGSTSLFAVEHDSSTGRAVLHIYPSCGYGQPGGSACPEAHTVNLPVYPLGHVTVTVNPWTHNALVAYRDSSTLGIVLAFYDTAGNAKGTYIGPSAPRYMTSACSNSTCNGVDNGQPGAVPICGGSCAVPTADCTGTLSAGRGCARLADKVHVATKYDSVTGHRYAYVAYDSSYSYGGSYYMKANLDIVNIDNEASPTVVKHYDTTGIWPAEYGFNSFSSISTANMFTSSVGWFFYVQAADACSTYFVGGTDTALGLTSLSYFVLDGPFPTMRFDEAFGIGDYIGIVKRGLPGGHLFPTWAKPVPSTGSGSACVSCNGTRYSLGIFGSQVTP